MIQQQQTLRPASIFFSRSSDTKTKEEWAKLLKYLKEQKKISESPNYLLDRIMLTSETDSPLKEAYSLLEKSGARMTSGIAIKIVRMPDMKKEAQL